MKTLGEVIEKIEEFWVCPCVDEANEYCDLMEVREDVLHHLKEYRGLLKMWNDKLDKEQENQPLTWDELCTMEGKPVWVEESADKGLWWTYWVIWQDENAVLPEKPYGTTWRAYRKERK